MIMQRMGALALVMLAQGAALLSAADPLVRQGDTVALLGGTLVESLQGRGELETPFQLTAPELQVRFRNLGWSGDDCTGSARRVFGGPADGYARLQQDVQAAKPSLIIVGYGFAEASNGLRSAQQLEVGLRRLAGDLSAANCRLAFLLPFPLPGIKTADYAQALDVAVEAIEKVASESDSPVIDPRATMKEMGVLAFDEAGLRLSATGGQGLGDFLAAELLGVGPERLARGNLATGNQGSRIPLEMRASLASKIADKDAMFFHRYRPMNETYLFLFRKHEQGNNAVETEQFQQLVEQTDEEIWKMARQLAR